MAYREKVPPTWDGFQEICDSFKNHPTIDDLIAGIQCKKTKADQILFITEMLRGSHSLLDKSLYRLGEVSQNYNGSWAPPKLYNYGLSEQCLSDFQSILKRWLSLLKITTPRYNSCSTNSTEQSYYTASYLTKRPYELDMWGPASYGRLVFDLYEEMKVVLAHLEEGKQLCLDVKQKEDEINQDPEWKEQLHDDQFQKLAEMNSDRIEKRYHQGIVDTDNRIYQQMTSSASKLEFKSNGYHKYNEQECTEYVVTVSTLELQENNITPIEKKLWSDNFGMIKLVRYALAHLDDLLEVANNGKFAKYETLELIKWCDVKESSKRHEDSERILFEYIKANYHGNHSWYGWPSIFELNKIVKESVHEQITYSTRFERKLNRFLVESGIKREQITGEKPENLNG